MPLTGPQIGRIHKAIFTSYTRNELKRLLLACMDVDFDQIVKSDDFSAQVFELVRWADQQGRAFELVKCAHEAVPGNDALSNVYIGLLGRYLYRKPGPLIEFDWVTVASGDFVMGSDPTRDNQASNDEVPQHRVYLPEYRIARTPVTNAQYLVFLQFTDHPAPDDWRDRRFFPGSESCPVANVSWYDASAFCAWVNEGPGARVRLPTEAEWEKAARGTDGRIWPWGNRPPTNDHCNFGKYFVYTTAVGRFPLGASAYGLQDMAGNVDEWTSSLYKPYPYDAADGREDPEVATARTVRGGSFYSDAYRVRCACRFPIGPSYSYRAVGFRVVSPGF